MAKVTLTFDNGPEPAATPEVLECLAAHRIKATFFVMGRKVIQPDRRALAELAQRQGHWIGNHTFNHRTKLGNLDASAAAAEFDQTEAALSWLVQEPRLFRPYGGSGELGPDLLHPAVVERLETGKYTCVLWSSVPGDWEDPEGWYDRALSDCDSGDWTLLVLHDLPSGAMRHLDRFLKALRDRKHHIVQEFPPECTPIVNGQIVLPLEKYLRSSRAKGSFSRRPGHG